MVIKFDLLVISYDDEVLDVLVGSGFGLLLVFRKCQWYDEWIEYLDTLDILEPTNQEEFEDSIERTNEVFKLRLKILKDKSYVHNRTPSNK